MAAFPSHNVQALRTVMNSAAWADFIVGKTCASGVSCGEIRVFMYHLQEPSENKRKSGLSQRLSERPSHGFEAISIAVRQSWGIEWVLCHWGGIVKELDSKCYNDVRW